jgi:hypothetical protein
MGLVAKALGAGSEFTFRGETYRLSPWSFKIQGDYETYLEEQAVRSIRRFQKIFPKDEYESALQRVLRDVTAGVYTFGSEVVQDSLRSLPHLTHLTWLMLREHHPKVTKSLVEEMYREQLEELMLAVSEANADPTVPPSPGGQPQEPAAPMGAPTAPPLEPSSPPTSPSRPLEPGPQPT